MPLDLLQTNPFGWVTVEQSADEIDNLGGEVDGELYLHFKDFVIGLFFVSFGLEWRLASSQLVAEHPQAPNICLLVVELPRHYLRRHVVQSPAESLPLAE